MDTQTRALPNEHDLRKLHVRGIIAYATRCVRRTRRHYSSGRFRNFAEAIDYALHCGDEFAAGRDLPIRWKDVQQAVVYADSTISESVAVAVERLASAIASAQDGARPGGLMMSVISHACLAVDAAHDAVYSEEFIEAADRDFSAIQKMSPQKYPNVGGPVDTSPNGPLGPEWPIWESLSVLKRHPK